MGKNIKKTYQRLKKVKDKYKRNLLEKEGVFAVGMRATEDRLVVYMAEEDFAPSCLLDVPCELENLLVEVVVTSASEMMSSMGLSEPPKNNSIHYYGDMTIRPVSGGYNTSNRGTGTFGTAGGWMFSRKYNKPVLISNNHVFAGTTTDQIQSSRRKHDTNSLQLEVLSGGTDGNQPTGYKNPSVWRRDVADATITSISHASRMSGQELNIWGGHFGEGKFNSKVFVGGKEARVFSWSPTVISITIPNLSVGIHDVFISVEGDPILQPYWIRDEFIAELVDYIPMGSSSTNTDVAIAIPRSLDYVDENIIAHGGMSHLSSYYENGRRYQVKGLQEVIVEGLPVVKTGRTTGTIMSIIYDPSIDINVDYGEPFGKILFEDAWVVSDLFVFDIEINEEDEIYEEWRKPFRRAFTLGGDSGSLCLVADPQDIHTYLEEMSKVSDPPLTENGYLYYDSEAWQKFLDIENQMEIVVGNLVGTVAFGYSDRTIQRPFQGGGDKAIYWYDYWELEPLNENHLGLTIRPLVTSESNVQIILKTEHSIRAEIHSNTELQIDLNLNRNFYNYNGNIVAEILNSLIFSTNNSNLDFDLFEDTNVDFDFNLIPLKSSYDYVGKSALTVVSTSNINFPFIHIGLNTISIDTSGIITFGNNIEKPIRIGRITITLPNGKTVDIGIVDKGRSRIKTNILTKLPNEIGEFDVVNVNHEDASPVRIIGNDSNVYALSKY